MTESNKDRRFQMITNPDEGDAELIRQLEAAGANVNTTWGTLELGGLTISLQRYLDDPWSFETLAELTLTVFGGVSAAPPTAVDEPGAPCSGQPGVGSGPYNYFGRFKFDIAEQS